MAIEMTPSLVFLVYVLIGCAIVGAQIYLGVTTDDKEIAEKVENARELVGDLSAQYGSGIAACGMFFVIAAIVICWPALFFGGDK